MRLEIEEREAGKWFLVWTWDGEITGPWPTIGQLAAKCWAYDADTVRSYLNRYHDDARRSGSFEKYEAYSLELAALSSGGKLTEDGFVFESRKAANDAYTMAQATRRAAKNIFKDIDDLRARWPEWAHQASAAGWTPPPGWKP